MPPKPVITIKEVRKILGRDCNSLSDTQIEEIINTLSLMARRYLRKTSSKKTLGMLG